MAGAERDRVLRRFLRDSPDRRVPPWSSFLSGYRYVSNPFPPRCGCALKVLSVKRSPEARNSLNDPFRNVQVTCSMSAADKCKARRMAAPIAPAEVKITALAAGGVLRTTCASPRSTREQKSFQDSIPAAVTSPATHLTITASKSL